MSYTLDSRWNYSIPLLYFKQVNKAFHFSVDLFSRKPKRICVLSVLAELLFFKTVQLFLTEFLSEPSTELIFILLMPERSPSQLHNCEQQSELIV